MARARVTLFSGVVALLVLAPRFAVTATAQTTINQTSCVDGVSPCRADPTSFLQTVAVNCNVSGAAGRINTALQSIADRNGPNLIQVSGACNIGFSVAGFNRLTIDGGNATTITRGVNIVNSRNISLKSLTFDFGGLPQNLALSGSQVTFDGVTVKHSGNDSAVALRQSGLGFQGAASLITNNNCNGISVGAAHSHTCDPNLVSR